MIDHDLSLLQTLDGQYIIHTSKQGVIRVIDGMLQTRSAFIPGGSVDMISTETVLHIRAVDAHDMQIADKIAVEDQTYEIAVIRPDNESICEIILEKL